MLLSHIHRLRAGFSLITASIVLTVAALVFVSMLPGDNGGGYNNKVIDNTTKLERIEEAMRSFMAKNGRRPCPADGQYAFNTLYFGVEAANPGTCVGGTPSAPLGPDAGTGYVVGGVIPTKTLGLPDDYAIDSFGHRFGYEVDTRATSNSSCVGWTNGGIKIKSSSNGTLLAQTMYAYISYGASGYGAYPYNGSAAGPANRINSHSTDVDMQTNAGVDSNFNYNTTNFTNTLVQKPRVLPTFSTGGGDTGFDDMVWYRNDTKNTCALGSLSVGAGGCSTTSLTSFSPSSMSNGQTLNAYVDGGDSTCTVNSLHCANGTLTCNGSSTLTNCEYSSCILVPPGCNTASPSGPLDSSFSPSVMTSGQTVSAYVSTSDLTCTANSLKCSSGALTCNSLAPLSSCEYSACSLACGQGTGTGQDGLTWGGTITSGSGVTAYQSNTAVYPSACASQTRTCVNGTLSGSFTAQGPCTVIDNPCVGSGALSWVGTIENGQQVLAYQNSSVVSPATCSSGTITCNNAVFSNPTGYTNQTCTVSTAGVFPGVWVGNWFGTNPYGFGNVNEYSTTGTYITQIGTPLTGNGNFNRPNYVAIDGSNNIWIVDQLNTRVEGFNSAGTFLLAFGSAGTLSGQFMTIQGITAKGTNLWVSDGYGNVLSNPNFQVEEYSNTGTYITSIGSGIFYGYGPAGVVIDGSNNIWVEDYFRNQVDEFNSSGTYITVTSAGAWPQGIAMDPNGSIWTLNVNSESIDKFNSAGTLLFTLGSAGSGNGQFEMGYGVNGTYQSSGYYVGIASNGTYIWASDNNNNRIQKFNTTGTWLASIPSCYPIVGNAWVSDTGNNRVQEINSNGTWLASIPSNNCGPGKSVWVADTSNNRIETFSTSGTYISQLGRGQGNGQFQNPTGITINSGNIWVVDSKNNRLEEFNSTGTYLSQIANDGFNFFPQEPGVAIDSSGNIWVSNSASSQVLKLSPTGTWLVTIGSGTGNGQVEVPQGIVIDNSNNVWVADSNNTRVEEFNSNGTYLLKFGASGTGNGQFGGLGYIAIDGSNNIWVADTGNNRVQKFNSTGTYLLKFGSSGTGNGQFTSPVGIAIDSSSNLWVTDAGNDRVEEFNSNGTYLSKFGSQGTGNGQLQDPNGIAIDGSGNLWIVDDVNNRVQEFNSSGTYLGQIGNNIGYTLAQFFAVDSGGNVWATSATNDSVMAFSSSGTYLLQFGSMGTGNGQFTSPEGIAIDGSNNVWVVDKGNSRVQKFNSTGTYLSKFGSLGTGNGQFSAPEGIAIDNSSNLWVVDNSSEYVEKFNSNGTYLSKFGAVGTGNGQFEQAVDIAIDSAGNLWVTDSGNSRVQEFNSSGSYLSKFGTNGTGNGQFSSLGGIYIDSSNNIWVADAAGNRIEEFNSSGTYLNQFGSSFGSPGTGNGQLNSPQGIIITNGGGVVCSSGSGAGQFNTPKFTAIDSGGNVWVTDSANNRVQEFNSTGTYLLTVGGTGNGNGQLNSPTGIAFSGSNLWVTDKSNNRLEEFNSTGTYLMQFGTAGTLNGQFNNPYGVFIDSSSNIWVTDSSNNRVQKFNSNGTYLIQLGAAGTLNGQFNTPYGVFIDGSGDVWVGDSGNNRVQEFNGNGTYLMQFGTAGTLNGNFTSPAGITIDLNSNIWVGDSGNNRVQEFNSTGTYLTQFGAVGTGNGQFKSLIGVVVTGTPATCTVGAVGTGNGQFNGPGGLAIDSNNNLWVADYWNFRVQEFNAGGTFLQSFGTPNGEILPGEALAIDSSGNVWVGDSGSGTSNEAPTRVQKFNSAGTWLFSLGSLLSGSGNGQFNGPSSIALDSSSNAWVVDSKNNRVQEFNNSGTWLQTWPAGCANTAIPACAAGTGNGQFSGPGVISIDNNGNFWVVDNPGNWTSRTQEFNASGTYLGQSSGYSPDSNYMGVQALGYDIGGNAWELVHNEQTNNYPDFEKFNSSGTFLKKMGNYASYIYWESLTVDGNQNVWITLNDTTASNNEIQEYNNSGTFVGGFNRYGSGTYVGQMENVVGIAISNNPTACTLPWGGLLNSGQNIGAFPSSSSSSCSAPNSLSCSNGTLTCNLSGGGTGPVATNCEYASCTATCTGTGALSWVGTLNGSAPGNTVTAWNMATANYPDVCTSQTLTCNNGVLSGYYTSQTCNQYGMPCTLPWGGQINDTQSVTAYQSAYANAPAVCSSQSQTRTCSDGTLSGTYANGSCTQVCNESANQGGGELNTSAPGNTASEYPSNMVVIPATCPTPNTLTCSSSGLSCSDGILADCSYATCAQGYPAGVWVVDTSNNRLQQFTSTGTWVLTLPASGCTNASPPACPAGVANGQFSSPARAVTDNNGNIWVADSGNNRIQEISPSGTWLMTWPAGCANGSPPACTASVSAGQFSNPQGIYVLNYYTGNFWVADTGNNRIELFNAAGTYVRTVPSTLCTNGSPPACTASYSTGRFASPTAITGPANLLNLLNIYVADSGNNRLEAFQANNGNYQRYAGGTCINSSVPACTASSNNGWFNTPLDVITTTGTYIYAVDSLNHRVESYASSTGSYNANFGSLGLTDGKLENSAQGITMDSDGNLWVSDTADNRVEKFTTTGTWVLTIPGGCADASLPACAVGTANGVFDGPVGITYTPGSAR